jgi:HPt (histidine-containing phosphotransfer) domain-containing protein
MYSSLGGDPELAALVEWFVQELPKRAAAMLERTDASDWEGLRQAAHQLKGAGGSYGFAPLTPAAARLEEAIAGGEGEEEILAAVVELVDLCLSARAGAAAG